MVKSPVSIDCLTIAPLFTAKILGVRILASDLDSGTADYVRTTGPRMQGVQRLTYGISLGIDQGSNKSE